MKTIPPYKPVANEAHNSDSEKEPESGTSKNHASPPVSKKRSGGGISSKVPPAKAGSNKSNNSISSKTVHNNKNVDKSKVSNSTNNKSDKSDALSSSDQKVDKKDQKTTASGESSSAAVEAATDKEKDVVAPKENNKSGKKRKVNSRTPTPVSGSSNSSGSITASDISVVVTPLTAVSAGVGTSGSVLSAALTGTAADSKKSPAVVGETSADKIKKVQYSYWFQFCFRRSIVYMLLDFNHKYCKGWLTKQWTTSVCYLMFV